MNASPEYLDLEAFIDGQLPPILAAQNAVLCSPTTAELTSLYLSELDAATQLTARIRSLNSRLVIEGRSNIIDAEIENFVISREEERVERLCLHIESDVRNELRRRHFLTALIANDAGAKKTTKHHRDALRAIKAPPGVKRGGRMIAGLDEYPYEIYFGTGRPEIMDAVISAALDRHEIYPIADPVVERTVAGLLHNQQLATTVYLKLIERGDAESLTPLENYIDDRTETLQSAPLDLDTFNQACILLRLAWKTIKTVQDAPVPRLAARATQAHNKLVELLVEIESDDNFSASLYGFSIKEEDDVRED